MYKLISIWVLSICFMACDLVSVPCDPNVINPISGSPFSTGGGNLEGIAFNANGSLIAVADSTNHNLITFRVAPNGVLTLAGSTSTLGTQPVGVAFSPNSALVAVVNNDFPSSVSIFQVASDGLLTAAPGSPNPTGGNPLGVAFSPNGTLLAVTNRGNDTVSMFRVESDGSLTVISVPFSTGEAPNDVAFNSKGTLLAVANFGDQNVSIFRVSPDGILIKVAGSPFLTGE